MLPTATENIYMSDSFVNNSHENSVVLGGLDYEYNVPVMNRQNQQLNANPNASVLQANPTCVPKGNEVNLPEEDKMFFAILNRLDRIENRYLSIESSMDVT